MHFPYCNFILSIAVVIIGFTLVGFILGLKNKIIIGSFSLVFKFVIYTIIVLGFILSNLYKLNMK